MPRSLAILAVALALVGCATTSSGTAAPKVYRSNYDNPDLRAADIAYQQAKDEPKPQRDADVKVALNQIYLVCVVLVQRPASTSKRDMSLCRDYVDASR